jgi:hypothetical protein
MYLPVGGVSSLVRQRKLSFTVTKFWSHTSRSALSFGSAYTAVRSTRPLRPTCSAYLRSAIVPLRAEGQGLVFVLEKVAVQPLLPIKATRLWSSPRRPVVLPNGMAGANMYAMARMSCTKPLSGVLKVGLTQLHSCEPFLLVESRGGQRSGLSETVGVQDE